MISQICRLLLSFKCIQMYERRNGSCARFTVRETIQLLWLPYAFLMVWSSRGWVRGRVYILSTGTQKHTLSAGTLPTTSGLERRALQQKEAERVEKVNPKCEFHISEKLHNMLHSGGFLSSVNHSPFLFLQLAIILSSFI